MIALAGAMGALAQCTDIGLGNNRIGDAGLSAFAGALSRGALDKINQIALYGNSGSSAPVDKALKERKE